MSVDLRMHLPSQHYLVLRHLVQQISARSAHLRTGGCGIGGADEVAFIKWVRVVEVECYGGVIGGEDDDLEVGDEPGRLDP